MKINLELEVTPEELRAFKVETYFNSTQEITISNVNISFVYLQLFNQLKKIYDDLHTERVD